MVHVNTQATLTDALEDVFKIIATFFEVLGTVAMVGGFIIAMILGIRALTRGEGGTASFHVLRVTLGGAILLGLEILVAADLVRTITSNPSIEDAVILGLIVIIRTILSMSIQIEIDGCLPWRRAALTSGATVVAGQVRKDRQAAATAKQSAQDSEPTQS